MKRIKSEDWDMKILKIENGCGYFLANNKTDWTMIDQIDKEGLLALLNLFLENEASVDVPSEENPISNQAHQIIYNSVRDKLETLRENKNRFHDESARLYLSEIEKYSQS